MPTSTHRASTAQTIKAVGVAVVLVLLSACTKSPADRAQSELNAGIKAQKAGKLDDAIKDYHAVLAIEPHNPYAFFDLGVIEQNAGRLDNAEADYREAIQISPKFVQALFNLATVRAKRGDNADAAKLYRDVIALAPNDAAAHLNLGFALRATGDTKNSNAELQKAVDLDPALATRIPKGYLGTPTPTPAR